MQCLSKDCRGAAQAVFSFGNIARLKQLTLGDASSALQDRQTLSAMTFSLKFNR